MLARQSIRTKLVIAVSLMLAVMLTLALSALWGLYSYRGLASSLSDLRSEIAPAIKLSQSAQALRDAAHCIRNLQQHKQLAEPQVLLGVSRSDFENNSFAGHLADLEKLLDSYSSSSMQTNQDHSWFVDPKSHEQLRGDIRRQLVRIRENYDRPTIEHDEASFQALQTDIDSLVNSTTQMTSILEQGMADYSNNVRNAYRTAIAITWFCLIAAVVMVGVSCILFRSLVMKPFRTLVDGARLVAAGEYQHQIDLGTGDELSELATVLNQMTDRFRRTCATLERERADLDKQVRERSREVVQREQLASVGFLAAGVAHEINNPLASIAWSAEALELRLHRLWTDNDHPLSIDVDDAELLGESLKRIQDEAYRCKGITTRLLDFSRMGDCVRTQVDVCELIRDVVAMVSTLGKYRCKTIRTHCDETITAHVNGQEIRQVVLNLVTNALESVNIDGAVDIYVHRDASVVRVAVVDNGCGMTEEVLEHLFEPFFTRRRDGSGTGLGLSITHRIVTQHGGQLIATSDGPGRGSRFEFDVPAEKPAAEVQLVGHRPMEGLYAPLRAA